MKSLFLILITCFSLSICAQGEFPRNSLIVHADPGVGSLPWTFPYTNSNSSHERNPWFNFSVGVNYERAFNDNHSIITGVDFHSIGDISIHQYQSVPSGGDSSSIHYSESPGHLYQIGIPLIYSIGKAFNKFRVSGQIGLINSFGVAEASSTTITNFYGEKTKYKWDTFPITGFAYYLDAKVGVHFSYLISEQISIGLEPYARIGIYTPSNFKSFFNHWNFLCAFNCKYTFQSKN